MRFQVCMGRHLAPAPDTIYSLQVALEKAVLAAYNLFIDPIFSV